MTVRGSERKLEEGAIAREFAAPSFADAELLADALEYFRAGRYGRRKRPMPKSSPMSPSTLSAYIIWG
jgi:hypothetical protein